MRIVAGIYENLCGSQQILGMTLDTPPGFSRPAGYPYKIVPKRRIEHHYFHRFFIVHPAVSWCNTYFKFGFCGIITAMKILMSLILLALVFSSCRQAPTHPLEFPWKPYSQQAVDDAAAHKRPVVIDFFADWCPLCHELDQNLLIQRSLK